MEQKNKGCFYVIGDTCVLEKKKQRTFEAREFVLVWPFN